MLLIGISSLMSLVTSDENPTVNSSVILFTLQVITIHSNEVSEHFLQYR
jgi:hypothetical protein